MTTSPASKLDPVVYKEGLLFKRQRGLKQGNTKKLKFQERFCRLTCTSLDYYDPNIKKRGDDPKGQFAVEQIKVVEAMEKDIFGREYPYAFQIGDSTEIMYFVAKTQPEMEEWLSACRHVAKDAGNLFLTHHHHGVFGLINKSRWSCCANTSRGSPGCSPSTCPLEKKPEPISLTKALSPPVESTPSPVLRRHSPATPRSATPNFELEPLKDSSESEEDGGLHPPRGPMIRRFTLADPIYMPPDTPKRLKELRRGVTIEKDSSLEESAEEKVEKKATTTTTSSDLSKEKNNFTNSLNSLNSLGSSSVGSKKEEEPHREGVATSKESLTSGDSRVESGGGGSGGGEVVECSTHRAQQEAKGNRNGKDLLPKFSKERTGASSPSPSVDSGRGVSRPNSQIDVVDLRVSRTESVGKKSVQSVVSDQGALSEEGKHCTTNQIILEEHDGPTKHTSEVGVATVRISSEKTGEKSRESSAEPPANTKPHLTSPRCPVSRKLSSPPAPDIMFLRGSASPEEGEVPRPLSTLTTSESVDAELSKSVTPQHRKLLANMATGSPKPDRPRSVLLTGITAESQQYSKLHQACRDGNLAMLKEELAKVETTNRLDEPSNAPVPYPPLFIAYMHDHYQIMLTLLEHGASPNCVEPVKKAPLLQWASDKGCLDIVDLLVKYKADVNKRDGDGDTPLMAACRKGHMEVVEFLLENGANVDDDSNTQRTALHEATEAEHVDITELLLKQSDVDPTARDSTDHTPYDIAYLKKNAELMHMLQAALPKAVRPYSLLLTNTEAASQTITSLVLRDKSTIITGSRDCRVKFFDMVDLAESYSIRVLDTVLGVSLYATTHLILGSTSIQLVDVEALEKRRTIADDSQEDENLLNPPLHLVQFGPKGQIATASVESNVVKLWPAVSQNTGHITYAENMLHVGESKSSLGCVYSLAISPDPNHPWLAVALQPGKMSRPEGFKLVYCYNLDTKKLHHIFDAGDGGLGVGVCVTFSPDGKRLAIGCSEHLCIWEMRTGNLLQKFTTSGNASILSLSYSPNGSQLATGLTSGEVQVFEILSSSPVFVLPPTSDNSPVTAVAYSSCGNAFASGHQSGTLRLWEVYHDDSV